MRQILKITLVLIGTLIGAGFASGKEIYTFFLSYGKNGVYGILLSSFLTSMVIYKVFSIVQKQSMTSYTELVKWMSTSAKR